MRIRKLRPTPGALIATIALVFAFTGGAIAASKIDTGDIKKKAVTGSKIASNAVKGGKIANGKVKAKDLAPGVIPDVRDQAYGRVLKDGNAASTGQGAVGITGVNGGGPGVVCYDLAFAPVSGNATVAAEAGDQPGSTIEVQIGPAPGCQAPFNDAQTSTTGAPGATSNYQEGSPADEDVFVHFIR